MTVPITSTILADMSAEQATQAEQLSHVLPLTILCLLGIGIPVFFIILSWLLGRNNPNSDGKQAPYECGLQDTVGSASDRFSVKFYIIAMLFLVFDLEVAFLYPFAVSYMEISGWGMFVLLMIFLLMLEVAYLYLYKKGALDWES